MTTPFGKFSNKLKAAHGQIDIALSVVTIAELVHGVCRANDDERKRRRLAFIEELCSDVPVHPITVEIARRIGRIEGEQAKQENTIAFEDLAIGVTALYLGFDVATINVRHFQCIPGLNVIRF